MRSGWGDVNKVNLFFVDDRVIGKKPHLDLFVLDISLVIHRRGSLADDLVFLLLCGQVRPGPLRGSPCLRQRG